MHAQIHLGQVRSNQLFNTKKVFNPAGAQAEICCLSLYAPLHKNLPLGLPHNLEQPRPNLSFGFVRRYDLGCSNLRGCYTLEFAKGYSKARILESLTDKNDIKGTISER